MLSLYEVTMDRMNIFTESVNQIGLDEATANSVVELAKACLESSMGSPAEGEFSEASASAYVIDFGNDMTALEEEYAFRDGWGHKYSSKVVGSKVYYSEDGHATEGLIKILKDWYPDSEIGTESVEESSFFAEY